MRKTLALFLAGTLILAGCGGWRDSRVNPGNWFGKSNSVAVATDSDATDVNPLLPERQGKSILAREEPEDLSVLVAEISALKVEPTPTGAIIYATGVAERQGAHEVQLRPALDSPAGTLEFTFNVVYPEGATAKGSVHSRSVHAAVTLSDQDLAGIRTIRVNGANNARDSRRK